MDDYTYYKYVYVKNPKVQNIQFQTSHYRSLCIVDDTPNGAFR